MRKHTLTENVISGAVGLTLGCVLGFAHMQAAADTKPVYMPHETPEPQIYITITSDPHEADPEELVAPENVYQRIWSRSTDEEKDVLVRILALEAQDEPMEGERAVVEVILNRVASPEWPDTIHGVLSQKGQFATWKYLSRPYNTPTEDEYRAVEETVAAGPSILPDDYVYFATRKVNGHGFIQIKHHYFSK